MCVCKKRDGFGSDRPSFFGKRALLEPPHGAFASKRTQTYVERNTTYLAVIELLFEVVLID